MWTIDLERVFWRCVDTQKLTITSLLALAIPSILSSLLNNAYRIIDQYAVQWIGTAAQAAMGSCAFVLIAAFSLFFLIAGGTGPLVGRAFGAGNQKEIKALVGQSLVTTTIISVVYCILLIQTAPILSSLVGLEAEAEQLMTTYLRWLGITGFFIAYGPLIDSIYIAIGNTKFPMLLQLIATIINAFLNWIFIYKLGWGIAGAAAASGISRAIASLIGLGYLITEFTPSYQGFSHVRRMLRIGSPISAGILSYALVYWVLLYVAISPLGEPVNAALGIGFSALEGISWPIFAGVMMAAISLTSRKLGAGDFDGLDRMIRLTFPLATFLGLMVSATFWFGGEFLCSLFTSDPVVLEQAIFYAHVLAFSQVFVAWEALSEGILEGAGDTKTILWISLPFNFIRIPLGWFLAIFLGWNAFGIWWAINISTYLKAAAKMLFVAKGKWRQLEI